MKENMFDVLIYLFENYLEDEVDLTPNSNAIRSELLKMGFSQPDVSQAFDWLDSLDQQDLVDCQTRAFRIFSEQEKTQLDIECRNLLIFLEHTSILSPDNREIVIDRAMALEDEISLDQLKWIVLMVLLSQSDDEVAYSRMEDIVYDLTPAYLH
ncbi:MAG: DUF494 family protein [Methylococcaceae bacterium]|nr:DUF494 family protein [Methylococcaceae bacterium]